MSKISEFKVKQDAHNEVIDKAIAGLVEDNKTMTELIRQLQNNPGPISPEDQEALDTLEARTKLQADKLEALDALTPPAPPA